MDVTSTARKESLLHALLLCSAIAYAFLLPFGKDSTPVYFIAFLFLLLPNLKQKIKSSLQNKFVLGCALFFAIHLLWSATSDDMSLATHQIKGALILLLPIALYHVVTKQNREILLFAFIVGFFLTSLFSYLIFFDLIDNIFHLENKIVGEPLAFLYKIDFTIILNILLFYLIVAFLNRYKMLSLLQKFFFLSAILMLILNLFFIGSRTAVVVFGVGLVFTLGFLLFRHSFSKKVIALLMVASVTISALGFMFNEYDQRFLQEARGITKAIEKQDYMSSSGARLGLWKYGFLAYLENNLLVGSGTKNQLEVTKNYMESNVDELKSKPEYDEVLRVLSSKSGLHNYYMDILVQFGLVGLACFFTIFFFFLFSNKEKHEDETFLFLRYITALVLLVSFLTGGDFATQKLGSIFIFLASLVHLSKPKTKALP